MRCVPGKNLNTTGIFISVVYSTPAYSYITAIDNVHYNIDISQAIIYAAQLCSYVLLKGGGVFRQRQRNH